MAPKTFEIFSINDNTNLGNRKLLYYIIIHLYSIAFCLRVYYSF